MDSEPTTGGFLLAEKPNEQLKLFNSLSRKKEAFIPLHHKQVTWYSCGPTVYDASHMGHARAYITFDIIRRVLSDYFGYDILFVMNITDIDDKIINRARQNHLLLEYKASNKPLEEVKSDAKEALKLYEEKLSHETDKDKVAMLTATITKGNTAIETSSNGLQSSVVDLIEAVRDPLAKWLDKKYGAGLTDHSIFTALTQYWEEEYHSDMKALNILPPHVLTRVTEYVPEIIQFVEKIIENGYAYESNGSVYFDTVKFSTSPDHHYAKLVPEAVGDLEALAEGEGELSNSTDRMQEKKHENDFALWKTSKPGEPAWPSPWGQGRPGWHIECSVMACEVLGNRADIHTGGVDLKFPHHDNEIAQVEACYESDKWINYFLHAGHLTIEGSKMSKSLKNFITIKEALKRNTPSQLRLAFLLHRWNATLDYSENTMLEAIQFEKTMNEFFLTVQDLVRRCPDGTKSFSKWTMQDMQLNKKFYEKRSLIHSALCDSIDTPTVLKHMREMVSACNSYIDVEGEKANHRLLANIAQYISSLLRVFGVIPHEITIGFPINNEEKDLERLVMPYVSALADFREQVREIALQEKISPILQICDWLRDEVLVDLGVRLEDKKGRTTVKLTSKQAFSREAEKNVMRENLDNEEH